MNYHLEIKPEYTIDDIYDLYFSIPEIDRGRGFWILHDNALLQVKEMNYPTSFWRDDRSKNGQLLTRPIIIDNCVKNEVNFFVPE